MARPAAPVGLYSLRSPSPADPEGGMRVSALRASIPGARSNVPLAGALRPACRLRRRREVIGVVGVHRVRGLHEIAVEHGLLRVNGMMNSPSFVWSSSEGNDRVSQDTSAAGSRATAAFSKQSKRMTKGALNSRLFQREPPLPSRFDRNA